MNVNDLADRLEQFYTGTHIDKAAETLRQQAQEIENLRKELALQKLSDIGQEIEHQLTDEEMLEVYKKCLNLKNNFKNNEKRTSYFNFARAILRKASNK